MRRRACGGFRKFGRNGHHRPQFGAQIYENPFTSFGAQRNWALDHCAVRHHWVLFLDADEVANEEFIKQCTGHCRHAPLDGGLLLLLETDL